MRRGYTGIPIRRQEREGTALRHRFATALQLCGDVIQEHDDGVFVIIDIVTLAHRHRRKTEVTVQPLGGTIRGPHLQHGLPAAQLDGACQYTCQ